jgi:hypothetical protein
LEKLLILGKGAIKMLSDSFKCLRLYYLAESLSISCVKDVYRVLSASILPFLGYDCARRRFFDVDDHGDKRIAAISPARFRRAEQ